jgi:hypothetical protein
VFCVRVEVAVATLVVPVGTVVVPAGGTVLITIPEEDWRCAEKLPAMVGQKPARACATSARDCSKAASAALTF